MTDTAFNARYDAATSHRAPEGRVPGLFLFAWSPVVSGQVEVDLKTDPHNGAREAVDRIYGAMGHAGMKVLAEQVLPAGTARYIADVDQEPYLDGGLFVPYSPKAVAQLCFLFQGCFLHLKFPSVVVQGPHYDEGALDRWLDKYFRDQTEEAGGDCAELEMLGQQEEVWDFPAEALPRFERYMDALFIRFGFRHSYEDRRRMLDAVTEFVEMVAPDLDKKIVEGTQREVVAFAERYLAWLRHTQPEEELEALAVKASAETISRVEFMDRSRLVLELGLWRRRLQPAVLSVQEAVTVSLHQWLARKLAGKEDE